MFAIHTGVNTAVHLDTFIWFLLFLQLPEALICGSSSGTFWSIQRRIKDWWSGRIGGKVYSSSWSLRLWLRCGARRRRTAAWPTRSSAVPWGEVTAASRQQLRLTKILNTIILRILVAAIHIWNLSLKYFWDLMLKLLYTCRYYYKREILERVDGRRLVYKFGKNSSGWKVEEVGTGM